MPLMEYLRANVLLCEMLIFEKMKALKSVTSISTLRNMKRAK